MDDRGYEPIDQARRENKTPFHFLLGTPPFVAFMIAPRDRIEHCDQKTIGCDGFVPGDDQAGRIALPRPFDHRWFIVKATSRQHPSLAQDPSLPAILSAGPVSRSVFMTRYT